MKRLAASLLAFTLLSGGAFAADLPMGPALTSPVRAVHWDGLYAGAQIGAIGGSGAVSIPNYPSTFTDTTSGLLLGVYGGYNWSFAPDFIAGVEADAYWSNANGTHLSGNPGVPTDELYKIEQPWAASLRGRIGWSMDNLLLYATAGVAATSLTTQYVPLAGGVQSATVGGWTAGIGAELALTDQLSGRLEYRYSNYGRASFSHSGPSTVDYTTSAITAGLSYHF